MAECGSAVSGRVHQLCQPCSDKGRRHAADVFCSSCNEFQCNDCSSIHTDYDFLKKHTLTSVSEYKREPKQHQKGSSKEFDLKGLDICKMHNKRFKFYCEREKTLACIECAIRGHTKCKKIVEVDTIDNADQLEILRRKLRKTIVIAKQTIGNLKEADSLIRNDVQRVTEKLPEMRIKYMKMFDEFAENVTKCANSYRDKNTSDWMMKTRECEDKIKTMKNSLNTISEVEAQGTVAQQYVTERLMTDQIQDDVTNAGSFCDELTTLKVSLNFEQHCYSLKSRLGYLMSPVRLEIKYNVPKNTTLELITSIKLYQTGSDLGQPLYSGLDFLPDGKLVVVDNQNGKCKVYDENLHLLTSYKLPNKHPKSLVAVSDDEVAITTGSDYHIDFLQLSKTTGKVFSRTFKVGAQYYSISMKDNDNFVVSTINHTKPFRLVSMNGEEKDFDIKFPIKQYQIGESYCTYIRGQEKVVFTDKEADTIFIYDLRTNEKITVRDELIKSPCDVTVCAHDHVFVCCGGMYRSSVVELTTTGRVVSSNQLDMSFLLTAAISKDNRRLAVSNSVGGGDRRLSLYRITSV